jgi:hypothetical protein
MTHVIVVQARSINIVMENKNNKNPYKIRIFIIHIGKFVKFTNKSLF